MCGYLSACALACLLVPSVSSAGVAKKPHAVKKGRGYIARRRSTISHIRRRIPLRKTSIARYRALRRSKVHHRTRAVARRGHMPGLEIPPSRTEQIQQALIQAGDFHGGPTGRWDSQTRDAMKLYQQQNGFQATGLPDAKSLMKMGLGPHPLPAQADPLAQQAQADISTPADSDASHPQFPPQ
jgi:hypothetical protein